ncbi:hypothetical protein CFK41_14570 [Brachybacterium ginsengisoli]|uniref:Uncharacterized protein n=1 Tax=Brachybacterium ginsengisoli TaxID=1331682 RepID=A0A291H0I1_9MICO|nr:hypothetical protein [Brachybacterium ginsengisoli]ATG55866.1 hypothetical protein CFK41_14570 [Brachybacterium ginsengisoli]
MADTEQLLLEIRGAVDQLAGTARAERDAARGTVARHLADKYSDITDRATLREAARGSQALFRGGMGSFQDVGTAEMHDAVERLRRALSRAARRW